MYQPFEPEPGYVDPVVEAYKDSVDRVLLRENLELTHEQRVLKHQAALNRTLAQMDKGIARTEAERCAIQEVRCMFRPNAHL